MKNNYLFPLLDVTGNLPVISVAIQCWVSIILVKTWSEHVSNVSIGSSSFGGISRVLVDLMFFRICFMCPFFVAMEGCRCLILSIVRLGHMEKWLLLVAWSKFF